MNDDELKYCHEIVEDAIHWYSEFFHSASWLIDIEYIVLDKFKTNDRHMQEFRQYQLDAMKKLIGEGKWVRWCDTCQGKTITELYNITGE